MFSGLSKIVSLWSLEILPVPTEVYQEMNGASTFDAQLFICCGDLIFLEFAL